MQSVALIANLVTIVATIAGLLVGAVTWYTGHLRGFIKAVRDVPKVKESVDRIDERGRKNSRIIYAIAVALAYDRNPDPEAIADDLDVDAGANQFFENRYAEGRPDD